MCEKGKLGPPLREWRVGLYSDWCALPSFSSPSPSLHHFRFITCHTSLVPLHPCNNRSILQNGQCTSKAPFFSHLSFCPHTGLLPCTPSPTLSITRSITEPSPEIFLRLFRTYGQCHPSERSQPASFTSRYRQRRHVYVVELCARAFTPGRAVCGCSSCLFTPSSALRKRGLCGQIGVLGLYVPVKPAGRESTRYRDELQSGPAAAGTGETCEGREGSPW